jgi:hypothetical protein
VGCKELAHHQFRASESVCEERVQGRMETRIVIVGNAIKEKESMKIDSFFMR